MIVDAQPLACPRNRGKLKLHDGPQGETAKQPRPAYEPQDLLHDRPS